MSNTSSFQDKLQNRIMPVAEKLSNNKVISSIAKAMVSLMPVLIVGSFACLLAFVSIAPWQKFLAFTGITPIFTTINSLTLGMLGLYFVILVTFFYAQKLEIDGISTAFTALVVFLILTPLSKDGAIPMAWLGSQGMFSAIIIGCLTAKISHFFISRKITIKMPKSVPPVIEKAFTQLIPGIVLFLGASVITFLMSKTSLGTIHQVIYSIIQAPLQYVGTSFPAYLLMQLVATIGWFFGIHPNAIVSVMMPSLVVANAENLQAFTAGTPLPNIICQAFNSLCQPGGVGGTLGLALTMFFFAKSKRYKTLGKIAIIPAIFNINEPLIFGIPIMMNPLLIIPHILTPFLCTVVSYLSTALGFVSRLTGVYIDWTVPMVIGGYLGGGISVAILQAVLIAISILVWYPFFKMLDRKELELEMQVNISEGEK